MDPLAFDPNDPDIKRFSTQNARRPVINSTDPYVRRVVDASRARAKAAAGPAPVSAPVTDNIAPVATSAAASTKTLGARLMSGARTVGKGLGAAYVLGTGANAVAESIANDPARALTEADAADRGAAVREVLRRVLPFGTGELVARGIPDEQNAELGRASERAVGFVKNLAGSVASPVTSMVVPGAQESVPPVAQTPPAQPPAQPQEPSGVPAAVLPPPPIYRDAVVTKLPPTPVLSKEGGVFSALTDYQGQLMNYALATANRNYLQKAEIATAKVNNDAQANADKVYTDSQARALDEHKVSLSEQTAQLKARLESAIKGKEVVQDAAGGVVLVDKAAGTAQKITPTEKPTYAQFKDAAAKDPRNKGATEDDFKRAYQRSYGTK